MPPGGHHDNPKEHAIYVNAVIYRDNDRIDIHDRTNSAYDDPWGTKLDLDDPANAAAVLDVCRALHDRCPEQYHHGERHPGFAGRYYCTWCCELEADRRGAAGDGQR